VCTAAAAGGVAFLFVPDKAKNDQGDYQNKYYDRNECAGIGR
jgi:hypothetical protein